MTNIKHLSKNNIFKKSKMLPNPILYKIIDKSDNKRNLRLSCRKFNQIFHIWNSFKYIYLKELDNDTLYLFKDFSKLFIYHSNITDFEGLKGSNITHLGLYSYVKLENIDALSDCNKLQYLYIFNYNYTFYQNSEVNDTTDISSLQDKQLKEIYLQRVEIEDISSIYNCRSLEKLNIQGSRVTYIPEHVEFPNLKKIYISSNEIDNISFLRNSPKLESLYAEDIDATDLSFIFYLKKLKRLYCENIGDFSFLEGCKGTLEKLSIADNIEFDVSEQIIDLNFTTFPKLTEFLCNRVNNLYFLSESKLNILNMERQWNLLHEFLYDGVRDISMIDFSNMEYCYLDNMAITDISYLSNSPIKALTIWGCEIQDLEPIYTLKDLEDLCVSDVSIIDKDRLPYDVRLRSR